MKIYFNNLGIETSRVLDDVFVKNDVGRRIEAYFDGVDISSANISARLIIEWPNGDTTNALIMTKFIDASGFYIILPQLIQDGTATFTIRITNLLEDYLQNTPQFTREILESVDAADDTNITPAEYAAMQEAINENASNIIASLNAAKSYSDAQLNARLRVLNVDDISDENTILELYSDLASEYEETGEAIKFNFVGEDQGEYKYFGNVNADFGESGDPMRITFFKNGNIYYYYLHDTGEEIDVKAVQFEARNTTTTLTNEDKLITSAAVKAVTDLCARTTYVDSLIQQIVDGTIIAKKAECDKVGDDITTKYAKVAGNNAYTGVQNFDNANITIPIADQPTKPVRLSQLTDAIGKLQDGTTIVDKANKDRLGNVIDTTYAHSITAFIVPTQYICVFALKDANGNAISTASIDLPLESVVVGGEYDSTNKAIILTLKNGQEIEIPVGDLVEGLQTEITPSNKLASDLVDDTNQTHKFVTAEEKAQITANKNEIADVREIAEDALDRTSVHDDEIMQLTIDLDNVEARLDLAKFNKSDVDTSIANPTSDTKVLSEKVVVNELNKVNDQIDILKVRVRDLEKNVFDVVEDNTTKYQKVIPNNVLTYGGLSKLGGLTKKYNQLVQISDIQPTSTADGITITNNGNGTITINGTATNDITQSITYQSTAPLNHKIYIGKYNEFYIYNGYPQDTISEGIFANNHGQGFTLYIHIANGTTINSKTIPLISVDLTDIYGTGNEPTTVDQFLTDYPIFRNYVPYTTGTLDYAYTKKVDITGFNIWDEEWELGSYNISNGEKTSDNERIRSKNFITVIPQTTYYFKGTVNFGIVCYYDKDKNFVDAVGAVANTTLTIPSNVCYINFSISGTTYNNDICINISNTSLNGTYKPSYRNALLEAKIVAIKQKLVSLGYSADVLGYGLPNVYNYIDLENKQVVLNMGGYTFTGDEDRTVVNSSSGNWTRIQLLKPSSALSSKENNTSKSTMERLNADNQAYGGANPTTNTYYLDYNYWRYVVPYVNGTINDFSIVVGQTLVYELYTPITIDVSDILDNDDVIGELESGGTITFENDNKYPLPSNVTYLVEVE